MVLEALYHAFQSVSMLFNYEHELGVMNGLQTYESNMRRWARR